MPASENSIIQKQIATTGWFFDNPPKSLMSSQYFLSLLKKRIEVKAAIFITT